jgi:hypothetical protein
MKPYPGDRRSLLLETERASSWRHREPHPGDRGRLFLETEEAWRHRELSLETKGTSS